MGARCKCLVAALLWASTGSALAGAFSITATPSGEVNSLTLAAHVDVAPEDAGKNGAVYIAANVAGRWYFQAAGGAWTAWSGGALPGPALVGTLGSHAVSVLDRANVSALSGTEVYVGYGLDEADMLAQAKYAKVYTVPAAPAVAVARSALVRNAAPVVTDADKSALVAGNTAFALDLHRVLASDPAKRAENLFFSPHSISVALAMTYAGARGATATEMAAALRFGLTPERLHPAFDWLDLELMSRGQGAQGKDGQPFRLRVSNSLWGDGRSEFESAFLDTLALNYGAGMNLVDFRGDPETGRTRVNAWVSEQTEQRIKDILPSGSVDTLTRLVLVNAVYFNAAWQRKFDKSATAADTFTRLDGAGAAVDMMRQEAVFPFLAQAELQAIELAYDGGELGMLIVLPAAGRFAQVEQSLDADAVGAIRAGLNGVNVRLSMPKFRIEASLGLAATLRQLGMRTAFTDAADFSGISVREPLQVKDVLHKGFIEVDENGTEAAAATAVIVGTTSLPPPPRIMKIDRPFLFAIIDRSTGAVVFWGRVVDPRA